MFFRAALHVFILTTAVATALSNFAPGRAMAGGMLSGVEMVICSDGVERAIRVVVADNPVENSENAPCPSRCLDCLATDATATLASGGPETPNAFGSKALPIVSADLPMSAAPFSLPEARGPPLEASA